MKRLHVKSGTQDERAATACAAGFTACAEFLLDIAPLFTLLKGLIGCPVFCVFVIGSYKTQSFISLVQALPLGSVLNESDKGV